MMLINPLQDVIFDQSGYMVHRNLWTEQIATALASQDDIILSQQHLEMIYLVRKYYEEYHMAPTMRILLRLVGRRLGKDLANTKYLYSLFIDQPIQRICRWGGLPKPMGCSQS